MDKGVYFMYLSEIQQEYIVNCIYEYTKRPIYLKDRGIYNFECPICREGKSSGKKRRGFYIPSINNISCHNCGWKSTPLSWIQKVTGKNFAEIYKDNDEYIPEYDKIYTNLFNDEEKRVNNQTLPEDSINLLSNEVNYYKNNKLVREALTYIQNRRLDTAKYRPKAIYTTIKDKYCAGDICIPFYDRNSKIPFYQIRVLFPDENSPKYKSKMDSDKTLFNLDQIDEKFPYIFLFEGPIDSMFIKNSTALAGIDITSVQQAQLSLFPLHQKIWCLDNQHIDPTAKQRTNILLDNNECVFIWPKKYQKIKDINELCVRLKRDEISPNFILNNTACNRMDAIKKGYIF